MWKRVILARWQTCALMGLGRVDRKRHGLGLWRKIKMDWSSFVENLCWKVGKGNETRF